jgi:YesN/AraC family two-component response regulator
VSQSPDDRVAKKQATCVIVEDEIDIREMFCDFAKHAGLRVIGNAGDGREALEVIRQGRPDLVVTDLRLPFLTGPEIIATLRREIPATKFIAITGHQSAELFRETAGAGADAYLFKPVCLPEFSAAVIEVLAGWPHLSRPAFKLVWDLPPDNRLGRIEISRGVNVK